ncbi:hypothetical protein, partial [Streptococcus pneumoniae]|uniref:hypothetical protein n=1 Tax=Streptococcus pneumoniae TaxID=1313 RepID=UPI000A709889
QGTGTSVRLAYATGNRADHRQRDNVEGIHRPPVSPMPHSRRMGCDRLAGQIPLASYGTHPLTHPEAVEAEGTVARHTCRMGGEKQSAYIANHPD